MSRSSGLIYRFLTLAVVIACAAFADDQALWREYGLIQAQTSKQGKLTVATYRMKDVTGALAAWEMLRSPKGRACDLAAFCTKDADRTVIADDNYVAVVQGRTPTKQQVDAIWKTVPNKHEASLPVILTFIPTEGLVPDSARYILGPASLAAFAPELTPAKPGFNQGAEAQVAEYKLKATEPVHLALFYYPTPEMARLHAAKFKSIAGAHVKRSDVLVAIVYGRSSDAEANALLSRVQYEAKITWNDVPPPSPIKPLMQLLMNIIWLSIVLSGIGLLAGIMYGGMRLYRRKYGTLEADEQMITLHLTGD